MKNRNVYSFWSAFFLFFLLFNGTDKQTEERSFSPTDKLSSPQLMCMAEAGTVSTDTIYLCEGQSYTFVPNGLNQGPTYQTSYLLADSNGLIVSNFTSPLISPPNQDPLWLYVYNFELGVNPSPDSLGEIDCMTNCCDLEGGNLLIWQSDPFPPEINCVSDTNVVLNGNTSCTAQLILPPPLITDNCRLDTFFNDLTSTDTIIFDFPIGETEITWTAIDSAGNSQNCITTVTVIDPVPPSIDSCLADITIYLPPTACEMPFSWVYPPVTDNCTNQWSGTASPGDTFSLGSHLISLYISDLSNNQDSCSFQLTVVDTIAPYLDCPLPIIVNNDPGQCGAVVNWPDNSGDNCSIASTNNSHQSGAFFPLGTTIVSLSVTDNSGNTSQCSFPITVIDNETPAFQGPTYFSLPNIPGTCEAVANWPSPLVLDNCFVSQVDSNHTFGEIFPVGITPVHYTAFDSVGNSQSFTVNVEVLDTEAPVYFNCPGTITRYSTPDTCSFSISWIPPGANDNCAVTNIVASHQPGHIFFPGTTPVSYTFSDAAGNSSTCTFLVIIIDDIRPEIFNCPTSFVMENDSGICGAIVPWIAPTAADNCEIVYFEPNIPPGTLLEVGIHEIEYIAEDPSQNRDTCQFTVQILDTEPPIISCLDDITIYADSIVCEKSATWISPPVQDNCEVDEYYWFSSGGNIQTTQPGMLNVIPLGPGLTSIQYFASDTSGNWDTCIFTIEVTDTIAPAIYDCPDTIVVYTGANDCEAIANWDWPTYWDNCSDPTFLFSHTPGSTFPLGTTEVLYRVIDWKGNQTECSFPVIVKDTFPPIINQCIPDIIQIAAPGECGTFISWPAVSYIENCGIETRIFSHQSGDFFPVGITDVSIVLVDSAGNVDSCRFTVTVLDQEPPQILQCESYTATANRPGCVLDQVSQFSYTDNCPQAAVRFFPPGPYPLGTHTVSAVVTDQAGLQDSCSFTLIVKSSVDLQFSPDTTICRGDTLFLWASGAQNYTWFPAYGLSDPMIANPVAAPRESVSYLLHGYDAYCEEYDSLHIEVYNALTTDLVVPDSNACYGETIELFASGGSCYEWRLGDSIFYLGQGLFPLRVTQSGRYSVRALDTDKVCDGGFKSVDISVFPIPVLKVDIQPKFGSAPLQVRIIDSSQYVTNYRWTLRPTGQQSTLSDPFFQIDSAGMYEIELIGIGANQCADTLRDFIEVVDTNLYLPNAFTPNGDGVNDEYSLAVSGYSYFEIQIFNRWGQLLFSSTDPAFRWDGRYQGQALPEGTYTYLIKLLDHNGMPVQKGGTILIYR